MGTGKHSSPDTCADVGREEAGAGPGADPAARQLDEYFTGARHDFDLPVDLRLSSGFRRTVLDAMRDVPYGETVSYARLADAAGNPKAVRAAGSACATNPIPIVVPCHRVIGANGTLTGYAGGLERKQTLLELEQAARL